MNCICDRAVFSVGSRYSTNINFFTLHKRQQKLYGHQLVGVVSFIFSYLAQYSFISFPLSCHFDFFSVCFSELFGYASHDSVRIRIWI
jgi:hypothetical protein